MPRDGHAGLLGAVDAIDPSTCTYEEWCEVGMALHESGFSADDWDRWSRRDAARWHEGECARKWAGFGRSERRVGSGTIIRMAEARGWSQAAGDEAIGWDDEATACVDPSWVEDRPLDDADDSREWDPARQLSDYIGALFDDDDHVGYVTESWERDGRHMPSRGHWDRTAGQLRRELAECGGDVAKVIGDWDPDVGAWVRFNPLDGRGCGNSNVTEYRYALVESDSLPPERQRGMVEAMHLPCAAVVSSGGKSVHAIVRVDAGRDYDLYRKRVEALYAYCRRHGFMPDEANKNPSRLSRMPGVTRRGRRQLLLATSCGAESWAAWEEWVAESEDDLPDETDSSDFDDPLDLAPVLVGTAEGEGIMRMGQKGILTGDSKMGKSYCLIDLAEAVSTGGRWLGRRCARGKVLYVNLEIQGEEFRQRMRIVWDDRVAHGEPDDVPALKANFHRLQLRGRACLMPDLVRPIVRRIRRMAATDEPVRLVVVDPVYKVNGGDDNDSAKVTAFTNAIDAIIAQTGASVVYAHHHPKGTAGQKKSMDRMSGTGVYARDADVMMDMTAIEMGDRDREEKLGGLPAYRMSVDCRSFAKPRDRDFAFRWPRFVAVEGLERYKVEGEDPYARQRRGKEERDRRLREEAKALMWGAFRTCSDEGLAAEDGTVGIGAIMAHMGEREETGAKPTRQTVKSWAAHDWCRVGCRKVDVPSADGAKSTERTVFFDRDSPLENGWE